MVEDSIESSVEDFEFDWDSELHSVVEDSTEDFVESVGLDFDFELSFEFAVEIDSVVETAEIEFVAIDLDFEFDSVDSIVLEDF